jgi:hypothetical protein
LNVGIGNDFGLSDLIDVFGEWSKKSTFSIEGLSNEFNVFTSGFNSEMMFSTEEASNEFNVTTSEQSSKDSTCSTEEASNESASVSMISGLTESERVSIE